MEEKTVLIVGAGVAALAAGVALVEHNKKNQTGWPRFKVTIATSDDIFGGRASSWPGGAVRPPQDPDDPDVPDFTYWPQELPLDHGFHAVFDESTYVNFWQTLTQAGLTRDALVDRELISNQHQILVFESERMNVCRLEIKNLPFPFSLFPCNHLARAALELWLHGGWKLRQIVNYGLRVMLYVHQYRQDFDKLAELDLFHRVSFEKWCRDRGVNADVFNKMMFKFLFQGTYIAPNTMDATSALMGLWTILRDRDAAHWYYINGGITEKLMQPMADYLSRNGVTLCFRKHAARFETRDFFAIDAVSFTDASSGRFDYFISTLPLDSCVEVLRASEASAASTSWDDVFPDIAMLERDARFANTASTVNLQVWLQRRGLLGDKRRPDGDYTNVIAGLEPLCVMIDYKNMLPMYQDDELFPGSVLEVNGSLLELQAPEHYGYFECDQRFGMPQEPKTIEFAKSILIDIARRYRFPKLEQAVKDEAFLEWRRPSDRRQWPGHGDKIPPVLWKNVDAYNRFFVTGPGTLQYRPWVWREAYTAEYLPLRRPNYQGPEGYPSNLFIAGDWTRNGFDTPCMEGAARSGRMAALAVVKRALGRDATADPTRPEETRGDERFVQVVDPY